jgi:hypothetical protein
MKRVRHFGEQNKILALTIVVLGNIYVGYINNN